MSKKKTSTPHVPQKHDRPVAKTVSSKSSPAQLKREAHDARKFFLVLGIGTVLLVIFLYFIFVGRK